MKRHKRLFEGICSFENLLQAADKARRGKRFAPTVAAFYHRLEPELFRLQNELREQTYRPGPYRTFRIHDPKPRLISAAPFRDRVVHHALCNVIEPIYERSFIFDSYACRKDKGTHAAVDRLTAFIRRRDFVLKCDIRRFFPSIDHPILKETLRRKIGCPGTLSLIDTIIDGSNPQEPVNDYFLGDDLFTPQTRRRGLPLGNQTSQFFGNVYLDALDHFVKETLSCRCYIRYVDDFVLLEDDKATLWEMRTLMEAFLSARLRLRLHPKKQFVTPVTTGLDFLGYVVFPTHRRLRRANGVRFARRLRRMAANYQDNKVTLAEIRPRIASWIGHVAHADTYNLRHSLFSQVSFQRG